MNPNPVRLTPRAAELLFRLDLIVLASAFTLWTLPIAFGERIGWGLRMAAILPMILILLVKILVFRLRFDAGGSRAGVWWVGGFSVLWCIAFLRTAFGTLNIHTLFILVYLSFLIVFSLYLMLAHATHGRHETRGPAIRFAAMLTMGAYVVVNLLFQVVGIEQPNRLYLAEYPSHVLSMMGIDWNRTLFPLADGISSFGIISGGVLILFAPSLRPGAPAGQRLSALLVVLCCIPVILMTDSRGAMLFTLAAAALLLIPAPWWRFARWVPILISLLPLLVVMSMPSTFGNLTWSNRPASSLGVEERTELEQELCPDGAPQPSGALSNRPLIWDIVLGELRQPRPEHVIGFGFRGQSVAGLSTDIACIFLSYVNRDLITAHHVWLQTMLDIGYIGVLVTVGLLVWLSLHLSGLSARSNDPTYTGLLHSALYVVMAGSLEATLSPDYNGTFLLFWIAALLAALSGDFGRRASAG